MIKITRLCLETAIVGLLWVAPFVGAQTPAAIQAPEGVIANGGLVHTLLAAPVIGQPYSAVQVRKMERRLADGTRISRQGHHSVARDAEGRVRVERRMARGENGGPDVVMVFVVDPVAHTFATWVQGQNNGPKTAIIVKVPDKQSRPQPKAAPAQTATPTGRPPLVATTENLGTDTIDGLPVTMSRTTTIVPVGRAGNDAPITRTHEVWTSSDLKLVMKEQWEDPRSGELTVELDKFSRAEPDPALFRPPAGYVVKGLQESLKEMEEKLNDSQN